MTLILRRCTKIYDSMSYNNSVFRKLMVCTYSKTCLKRRRPKIGFQDRLSLNAGQKYCRMLQGEHCAILSTFIKLSFVIKVFVLSIFEWPLKTGFTLYFDLSQIPNIRQIESIIGVQWGQENPSMRVHHS